MLMNLLHIFAAIHLVSCHPYFVLVFLVSDFLTTCSAGNIVVCVFACTTPMINYVNQYSVMLIQM